MARLIRLRRYEHMSVQHALHRVRASQMQALQPGDSAQHSSSKWHQPACSVSRMDPEPGIILLGALILLISCAVRL